MESRFDLLTALKREVGEEQQSSHVDGTKTAYIAADAPILPLSDDSGKDD